MPDITLLTFSNLVAPVLLAIGMAQVVTGSGAGYPLRFVSCLILAKLRMRWLWNMVRCPYCCAWWMGLVIGIVTRLEWFQWIQLAFTSCGVMAVIQSALGGNGLGAFEDFDKVFEGLKEKGDQDGNAGQQSTEG
jgi:hypothetical protein